MKNHGPVTTSPANPVYQLDELRLDCQERAVLRPDGTAIPLTPRVFATLRYLVENAGAILDKEQIMEAVWPDSIVEENNLTQNISTLRRVLGDSPGAPRFIITVPGRGYRFAARVGVHESQEQRRPQDLNGSQHVESRNGSAADGPAFADLQSRPQLVPDVDRRPPKMRMAALVTVALLLFGAASFVFVRSRAPAPPSVAPEKSVAVLPFRNVSNDPQLAEFAERIKDEILVRLAQVRGLKVISRASTLEFNDSSAGDFSHIASRLGVANLLTGTVRPVGAKAEVTVQLIDAKTGHRLWGETFTRNIGELFGLEGQVAESVAAVLQADLSRTERIALGKSPTGNLEAYNAWLKGRYFWNKRTVEGYRQAVNYFNTAIQLDPKFAQAYAGLADAYLFLASDDAPEHNEALGRARAALQKALELDPDLAEAHATAGLLQENFDWDWNLAEREYKRAIELQPNYATAHQWYGEFLAFLGRSEEAIAEAKLACELDPLSLIINTDLAKVYAMTHHHDEAIGQIEKVLRMDPHFGHGRSWMANLYAWKGMREKAAEEIQAIEGWQENPNYLFWLLAIHQSLGDHAEAGRMLDRLREMADRTYVSPRWLAPAYALMGYDNEAFFHLEKGINEHASGLAIALNVESGFDPIRSDPRFQSILQRVHLAP
jgi:DNA-binding winged helix-turn-helix (wHTH) protein/TolB-like protein/Tfp pilus assembly protein PilF